MIMESLSGLTNIVGIQDRIELRHPDGIGWDICIRMELLTSLTKYAQKHPLSEKDVVHLGSDICKALQACELQHIIHRDIKPANIFINKFGDFKLGDFGIARSMEKTLSTMSSKGTYGYMAPEVYRGDRYGQTVDIYSLGMVLYRYLNYGREPFTPPLSQMITAGDRSKALQRRMKGEPISEPATGSRELKQIVLKAIAFDPEKRWQDAGSMLRALSGTLVLSGHSSLDRTPRSAQKSLAQWNSGTGEQKKSVDYSYTSTSGTVGPKGENESGKDPGYSSGETIGATIPARNSPASMHTKSVDINALTQLWKSFFLKARAKGFPYIGYFHEDAVKTPVQDQKLPYYHGIDQTVINGFLRDPNAASRVQTAAAFLAQALNNGSLNGGNIRMDLLYGIVVTTEFIYLRSFCGEGTGGFFTRRFQSDREKEMDLVVRLKAIESIACIKKKKASLYVKTLPGQRMTFYSKGVSMETDEAEIILPPGIDLKELENVMNACIHMIR